VEVAAKSRENSASRRPILAAASNEGDVDYMKTGKGLSRFVSKNSGYFFIAPAIIFLFVITIYPVLRTIRLSFSTYDLKTFVTSWAGFGSYARVFKDSWFWVSIQNTILFTCRTVILHLVIAWLLVLIMQRPWKWSGLRDGLRGFWILPWLFSNAAAALMWGLLYHPFGLLNYLISNSGLTKESIDFLGDPKIALWSLVIINVWKSYPIYFVLLLGAFQAIPPDLLEAANVEGANFSQRLRYVTMPLVLPAVLTMTMLDFITTFAHFDLVRMMTGGGPMRATETISYYIYRTGFKSVDFPYSSSLSVIMFLFLAVCSVVYVFAYIRSTVYGKKN
jgi:multiple sugar transport system permease protein